MTITNEMPSKTSHQSTHFSSINPNEILGACPPVSQLDNKETKVAPMTAP